ncbi:MAG: glycosyltransferase family 4 protein [Armatimonas sp.]
MPDAPVTVVYLDHTAKLSGGEIALVRLLESLNRETINPIVVLAEDGPLVKRLQDAGVETHIVPLSGNIRNVRKDTLGFGAVKKAFLSVGFITYSFRIAMMLRRLKAQVVHTNSLKADLYGALACSLARVPVVWHVRDHIDPSYLPGPAVRIFRTLAQHWPTYVVANSQSTLDKLFLGRHKPRAVIPSGIDLRRSVIHDGLAAHEFDEADAILERKPWGNPVRIGIVGRLAEWKGQHIFLEAARQVLAAGGKAEFLIAGSAMFGEADYEARLKKIVSDAGIEEYVNFMGFVSDVPALLSSLDVLVHASTTPEPFGQVVIEGMAEGLPVVGTDGGGVREIIVHGENGMLVPMGDADAMAKAIQTLLADPNRARLLGRAGYLRVRRHFTAEQTARKIERVYHEILNKTYTTG